MATLGVLDEIGRKYAVVETIALEILPSLWRFALEPTLNVQQVRAPLSCGRVDPPCALTVSASVACLWTTLSAVQNIRQQHPRAVQEGRGADNCQAGAEGSPRPASPSHGPDARFAPRLLHGPRQSRKPREANENARRARTACLDVRSGYRGRHGVVCAAGQQRHRRGHSADRQPRASGRRRGRQPSSWRGRDYVGRRRL